MSAMANENYNCFHFLPKVLKGNYYFNIGDHGGIIAAVKYFKTEGSTNELLYSTNEGITWQKLIFYSEPLKVFGLLTEPGENTTVFTIFGTVGGSNSIRWIIVRIDLRSVFERNCTESDYKRWSPSDNTVGKHRSCLLGRKEIYERRMINANCYNGRDHEKLVTVENCVCDRSDYQCDFGFHRDQDWSGACVRDHLFDDHDFYNPPGNCRPGKFYNQTRGYVKIRGDTCVGGKDNVYEPLKVACPVEEEKEFLLVAQRPNILRIDLRNLSNVDILPLTQIQNVIALEFDLADNCVIYGDIELDKIFIQCLNGTPPRVLVENNLSVEGVIILMNFSQ
jgi:sortilin-related receptor